MADSQKTEYPTRKRLDDARKKGNVPISKEFTSFFMILGYTVLLAWFLPNNLAKIFLELKSFYIIYYQYIGSDYSSILLSLLLKSFEALSPTIFALILISIASNALQIGFLFSAENIKLNWERISIRNGFKRLFSSKSLIETLFALLKFLIMSIVLFNVMKKILAFTLNLHSLENNMFLLFLYDNILNIYIIFTMLAAAIGLVDLFYRNYVYVNSLKMTKNELKDELRETEGNPEVKSRLRNLRKMMIKQNIKNRVKEANVVITNPTHYAVALKYDDSMPSPQLVAKGQDLIALSIKEIAIENKIAIVENVVLAQSLYKTVKVGDFINEEHYVAVAEIISYIYRNR